MPSTLITTIVVNTYNEAAGRAGVGTWGVQRCPLVGCSLLAVIVPSFPITNEEGLMGMVIQKLGSFITNNKMAYIHSKINFKWYPLVFQWLANFNDSMVSVNHQVCDFLFLHLCCKCIQSMIMFIELSFNTLQVVVDCVCN